MPIIVDKDKKRRDIALSVRELLLEKGIKNLSITDIVKKAGISRGSIYDYFETKEDIVFEIIMNDLRDFQKTLVKKFNKNTSTKEKVLYFFDFVLSETEKSVQERNVYKEYLSVSFTSKNEKMAVFNKECSFLLKNILSSMIQEGINKNELKDNSIKLVNGLLALEKGFLVLLWTEKKEIKKEFIEFLDTLFELMKKDK
ncbi:MAG: TetR/AcrR family transcriptional regulator [Campylobacteraceae bacterium]|nr:TetR/AcrR family transcriptional regulator [Campylobacteraceae bacterium]